MPSEDLAHRGPVLFKGELDPAERVLTKTLALLVQVQHAEPVQSSLGIALAHRMSGTLISVCHAQVCAGASNRPISLNPFGQFAGRSTGAAALAIYGLLVGTAPLYPIPQGIVQRQKSI